MTLKELMKQTDNAGQILSEWDNLLRKTNGIIAHIDNAILHTALTTICLNFEHLYIIIKREYEEKEDLKNNA